jgi:hypothetical protein
MLDGMEDIIGRIVAAAILVVLVGVVVIPLKFWPRHKDNPTPPGSK